MTGSHFCLLSALRSAPGLLKGLEAREKAGRGEEERWSEQSCEKVIRHETGSPGMRLGPVSLKIQDPQESEFPKEEILPLSEK